MREGVGDGDRMEEGGCRKGGGSYHDRMIRFGDVDKERVLNYCSVSQAFKDLYA